MMFKQALLSWEFSEDHTQNAGRTWKLVSGH